MKRGNSLAILNPLVYPKEKPVKLRSSPPFVSTIIFIGLYDTEILFHPFVSVLREFVGEETTLELANCADAVVAATNKHTDK